MSGNHIDKDCILLSFSHLQQNMPSRKEFNAKERCKNTLPAKVSFRMTTAEDRRQRNQSGGARRLSLCPSTVSFKGNYLVMLSFCRFYSSITELCHIHFFCLFEFGRLCSTICVTQVALCWPFIPRTFKYHRNGDNWGRHVIGCRRRVIGSQFGQLFNKVMNKMVTELKHEQRFY